MIEADWPRICGLEVVDDGTMAAAWIAHDRRADVIHLYDCCLFQREVLAVIGAGLNARGRWLPIAWESTAKAMAEQLRTRGCNMTPEPYEDSEAMADVVSRDIWERMRGSRFRVDKRLAEWLDEFRQFTRQGQRVPRAGHPLMTATRVAMAMYDEWARPERRPGAFARNHPKIAVV